MRFILEISDNQADKIISQMLKEGSMKREHPERPWTERERKSFIKHFLRRAVPTV